MNLLNDGTGELRMDYGFNDGDDEWVILIRFYHKSVTCYNSMTKLTTLYPVRTFLVCQNYSTFKVYLVYYYLLGILKQ